MNKVLIALVATSLLSGSAQAAGWQGADDSRPGAFAGARLQLPLGRSNGSRPRASLTIAPTQGVVSAGGLVRTRIGEGVAFNLSPGTKPTLTIAGARADTALGLRRQGQADTNDKLGISTGGWIAIGVGTVALALGGLALWADHVMDCEERENGC